MSSSIAQGAAVLKKPTGAGLVGFQLPTAGAIPRTVEDRMASSVVSVNDLVVSGATAAQNTVAIKDAILYAAANGVKRVEASGTFDVNFAAFIGGDYVLLDNVYGLEVDFSAAIINDQTAYIEGQTVKFLHPKNSLGVHLKMGKWTADVHSVIPSTTPRTLGAFIMYCEDRCVDCSVTGEIEGALSSFTAYRSGISDPKITKGNNLNANVTVKGVHYPYNLQNNGDNSGGVINGHTVGRSHFVYGVSKVDIFDNTYNSLKQALITTYEGNETSHIKAYVTDTTSTDGFSAAKRLGLRFSDQTPSKLTSIHYVLNIVARAGAADFGHILEIGKYNDAGAADAVARGHELKGLVIEGVMDTTLSTQKPIVQIGQLTGTDIVSGFEFKNLRPIGGHTTLVLDTYEGGIKLDNVVGGAWAFRVVNAEGTLTAIGCTADSFCGSVTDTTSHTYIDCVIADAGGTQNRNDNKNFIRTMVKGHLYDEVATTLASPTAAKVFEGDLSTAQNVFKVPAYTQISGTISYHVVADQSISNPSTRNETYGKKSFVGSVNSSGLWSTFLDFDDEVTERTKVGRIAADPLFALVDGDSDGAFITFLAAGAGYNVTNSRAVIKIESLTLTKLQVEPV